MTPSSFDIRGLRYRLSFPRMEESVWSKVCRYCFPSRNVDEVSPAVHLSTSARHPAMSESFCSCNLDVSRCPFSKQGMQQSAAAV